MHPSINLSLVIPAKDEEASIAELCEWIARVLVPTQLSYEVIFIDDGSNDNTWEAIKKAGAQNHTIKGIRFNRNYGKSAALQTGFRAAQGAVVITMDADLQDSPEELPELYRMITEDGFHLVSGWKKKRHDPVSKRWPSKLFNAVMQRISHIKLHDFNCGLKAYQSKVVKQINVYGEMHRYIPVLAHWAGFTKIGEKVVDHHERKYGHTKYGWERLVRGLLDLLTITFVGKFAQRPMHFFGTMGLLSFLLGFAFTVKMLWDKFDSIFISKIPLHREMVQQPIFYLALVALILGAQLFLTGFIAELLTRQSNSKREYIIAEKTGNV